MRVGIIGAGWWAGQHAAALATLEGLRVTAVSSGTLASAQTFAAPHGAQAFATHAALLDSVDRVVVLGTEAVLPRTGRAPVEVWEIDEPSLRGIEGEERMRLVREDILRRVREQAREWGVEPAEG